MLTSEDQDFLKVIRQDPTDNFPRLVYADWLEEQGSPRAACIRAEVEARKILGSTNVHGILDVEEHFKVTYTDKQLLPLQQIPFTKDTLRKCKGSHVLFAGYPLCIHDIRDVTDFYYGTTALSNAAFVAETKLDLRWFLLRKEPVSQSYDKSFDEQLVLLTREEEVPLAREVTFMVILHRLVHREHLLSRVYVRCRDKGTGGRRVIVGDFDSDGFSIGLVRQDNRHSDINLASARKPDPCPRA